MLSGSSVVDISGLATQLTSTTFERCTVLADERLEDSEILGSILELVETNCSYIRRTPVRTSIDLSDVVRHADDIVDSDLVVSIGGGRTIDTAKLATAICAEPALGHEIAASASGSLYHHGKIDLAAMMVAVSTTLGTGAERSQSAVVDNDHGRLIVGSPALRPRIAVHDARATRGLPRGLVMSGVFEAMCRAFGPASGQLTPGSTQDELVLAVTHRLVSLGFLLLDDPDPGSARCDDVRREVATLSGMSQGPQMHRGRADASFTPWYLATELSWLADVDKTRALAAVLPPCWSETFQGRSCWGSASSIERIWQTVRTASPRPLPVLAPEGLAELLDLWGLTALDVLGLDLDAVARRVIGRWGTHGEHLGELTEADVRSALALLDR